MKILRKTLFLFGCITLSFVLNMVPSKAVESCEISTYDIHIEIDKNAVIHVNEIIDVKQCTTKILHKEILKEYQYASEDQKEEHSYIYGVSSVKAKNAKVYEQNQNGKKELEIVLENPNQEVELSYSIRMRNYNTKDFNLLLYQILSMKDVFVHTANVTIAFPNRLDTDLNIYKQYQNEIINSSIPYNLNDKTITFTALQLNSETSLWIEGKFRPFYFTYSKPITLYLYVSLFSIALVIGSYLFVTTTSKIRKNRKLMECYPIPDVNIGMLSYYNDGVFEKRGLVSILLQWAYEGYIEIGKINDEVILAIKKELPNTKKAYELKLFELIFGQYVQVSTATLRQKNITNDLYEILKQMQEEEIKQKIFRNHDFKNQRIYAILIALPMPLLVYACLYEKTYKLLYSILGGSICFLLVYLAACAWFYLRNKTRCDYQKNYRVLQRSVWGISAFLILVLYIYLLYNSTPIIYIIANMILSIVCGAIFIGLEQRTIYGRILKERLFGVYRFLSHCRVDQLNHILQDYPNYFSMMLPYAYEFEIYDIWCQRFAFVPITAPIWFYYAEHRDASSYSWMNALKQSIEILEKSLFIEKKN